MDNYSVYMHTSPNGKKYIGITGRDPIKRWNSGSGYNSNSSFYSDIKKYGWKNIKHEVLLSGVSKEEAEYWERTLISKYNTMDPKKGYNLNSGGNHHGSVSKETRRKISENTTPHNKTPCMCVETGIRYNSMADAARDTKLNRNKINSSCLSKGKRSVKGLHFMYIKDGEEAARRQLMKESQTWEWDW